MKYFNGDYLKIRRYIRNGRVKLLNNHLSLFPLPAEYYDALIRFAVRREKWGIVEKLKQALEENMISVFQETEYGTVH